jgi:hypothetical protein
LQWRAAFDRGPQQFIPQLFNLDYTDAECRRSANRETLMSTKEHLDQQKLVELMVTQSETEANIIKSILEASQIGCVLVTQVPHNVYPFTINGLAAIKIKVLDSDLAAAKSILRDYENSELSEEENLE